MRDIDQQQFFKELICDINHDNFLCQLEYRESASSLPPSPASLSRHDLSPSSPRALRSFVTVPIVDNPELPPPTEVPSTSVPSEDVEGPSVDPELLQALGTFEFESNEWGKDISNDLSKRWEPILRDGLKKEEKEKLMETLLFPKNCTLIKPPVLNPELSAILNESAKNRDSRIFKKQHQLACALSMLGTTISDMLTKSIAVPDIIHNLSVTSRLIADSHYLETETRRTLVTPMVDKSFIEPFKDRKRDNYLFGEKLGEFVKSSCGIQRTSKLLQAAASTSTNLNSKPPPPRQHKNYRGARPQYYRGGGARAPTTHRRRQNATPMYRTAQAPMAPAPVPAAPGRHKQTGPKQK